MAMISIILALVAERFLLEQERYRQDGWFSGYMTWLQRRSLGEWLNSGIGGVIGVLLPPALVIVLIQMLLQDLLGGVLEFLFATAVLLYSLGPKNLDRQVENFVDAWDDGDETQAQEIAEDLIADAPSSSEPEIGRAVAGGVLKQACYRIFSVLFWFIVLGPLGALLYRLSRALRSGAASAIDPDEEFLDAVQRLLAILDWAPARVTAASYALAGNFQDTVVAWRGEEELKEDQEYTLNADDILLRSGRGALGLEHLWQEEEAMESPSSVAEAALGLVWRSLIIWIIVPTIIVIAFWLS
jgi:membrane protein required for beta-lactamase induction